jgi:small redox-active disulfide protein 2
MKREDVVQLKVDGHTVGIMGLNQAMEEIAVTHADKPDGDVADTLLEKLTRKNYIPPKVRASYKKAFLREFRKYLGKPFEAETVSGIEIKVLGPGCPQCDRLEQEVMAVISEFSISADIEHVRDVKAIGRWGVMGTPALIVNGEVKSVGKIPSRAKLVQWFETADGKPA